MVDISRKSIQTIGESEQAAASQQNMQRFQYKSSLNSINNEIRLIKLRQAIDWLEPIKCETLQAPMGEIEYQALSYTWGDSSGTLEIFVDDKSFLCTPNLYSALLHLRSTSKDLVLWADAIWIDQRNLQERNHQVQIMRNIYTEAAKVVVWLGPSDSDSRRTFKLLAELSENSHDRTWVERKIRDPESLDQLYGICRLFSRDYWSRVWVVQEVFSAKAILVRCGSDSVEWQILLGVQMMLCDSYDGLLAEIFRQHPAIRGYISWHGPFALRLVYGEQPTGPPDLFNMLIKHASKQATDARDKIYAFIGISSERDALQIDYSFSVRQVYMNLVYSIVKSSKSLDVICALRRDTNKHGLPSWVPDWSMQRCYAEDFFTDHNWLLYKVCASGSTRAQVDFNLDEGAMFVSGGCIDTIRHLGEPCKMEVADDFDLASAAFLNWWAIWKSLHGESVLAQETFIQTLCRDRIGPHHLDKEFTKRGLLQWVLGAFSIVTLEHCPEAGLDAALLALAEQQDWEAYPAQKARGMVWVSTAASNMLDRRFSISLSGIAGLVPNETAEGDKICIFLGCSVPVILRPLRDHYVFIGSAYIDGYMTGEAFGKVKFEKFKLC
jgi:hypothetical protein